MSRSEHLPPSDEEEEREQGDWIWALLEENLELEGTHPGLDVQRLSKELLLKEQGEDEVLLKVRGWVSVGRLPSKEKIVGKNRTCTATGRWQGPSRFPRMVCWFWRQVIYL